MTAMRNIDQLTVNQLKLIYIYLSKINPKDSDTKSVTISLKDYIYIMGNQRPMRPKEFIDLSQEMVKITATVPIVNNENKIKGFSTYPVFNNFSVYQSDKDKSWYVTIECHDKMLIHFFDLQSHYSSFKLWNLSELHSVPHIRLYDILQQYKGLSKIYTIEELRDLTGTKNKYLRWDNFKMKVIDEAQTIFKEKTDIIFDYEQIIGNNKQIIGIKFHIRKNPDAEINRKAIFRSFNYEEEIETNIQTLVEKPFKAKSDSSFTRKLHAISEYQFTEKQMEILEYLIKQLIYPGYFDEMSYIFEDEKSYYYLKSISCMKTYYDYVSEKNPKNKYKYLKKVLENQIREVNGTEPKPLT